MNSKQNKLHIIQNEQGFVLVVAMMMLVVLSFIGIAATNTTVFELQIAGNERQAAQEFNVADSGWKQAASFLNNRPTPPLRRNLTLAVGADEIVRNFGDGGDGTLNDDFPANDIDGEIGGIRYWYRVTYRGSQASPGSGTRFLRFNYDVESVAIGGGRSDVEVIMLRDFQIGY